MATVTVAALRQRLAAVVEALATPSAWRESRWSWIAFPLDPNTYAHLSFAVGATTSRFADLAESSRTKRSATGGLVITDYVVRWTYRLRGDAQVSDTDAALAAEQLLITALCGTAQTDAHVMVSSMRRDVVGDGTWLLGEIAVTAHHRIAVV